MEDEKKADAAQNAGVGTPLPPARGLSEVALAPFDRKTYQREYMRAYRKRKAEEKKNDRS